MLPIQTLHRHEAGVNAVILYGDFLLSGSEDHEIKVTILAHPPPYTHVIGN